MVAQQVNEGGAAAEPIGTALIVYGNVSAESFNGVTRALQVNSPIYLNDHVITGSDGMISIVFGDISRTQLDLGRMSDVVIDEDVIPGEMPTDIAEATADVEQIQQALLEGDFDPTLELEATAAGPGTGSVASDGGGLSYVRFVLTAEEVTPESGAETIGVGLDFLDPDQPVLELEPLLEPITPSITAAAAPAPAPAAPIPEIPIITPPSPPPFIPEPINRVVEEEELTWMPDYYDAAYTAWPLEANGEPWLYLSDGNPDDVQDHWDPEHNPIGPDDSPQDAYQPDSFVITGNMSQLVPPGTANFSIASTSGLPAIFSQGDDVNYLITPHGVLIGFVGDFNSAGFPIPNDDGELRPVFSLEVMPNGDYRFILRDQLDHLEPTGDVTADENFALQSSGIGSIDFSGTLQSGATTFAPGLFTITVTDDIPTVNEMGEGGISFQILEDGLDETIVPEGDSYPGSNNLDLSTGNKESGESPVSDEAHGGLYDLLPSVAALFKVGADEYGLAEDLNEVLMLGKYGITTDQDILNNLPTLFSHDDPVKYMSNGQVLTAYVGSSVEDAQRVVFTFRVDPDTGNWHFDLEDQLDHVAPTDGIAVENWELKTSLDDTTGITDIDLSSILTITDFDDDMVTGAEQGSFRLQVQDDIPLVIETTKYYFISEYAGYNNSFGTYILDEGGNPEFVKLFVPQSNVLANYAQAGTGDLNTPGAVNPYSYTASGIEDSGPYHYTPGVNLGSYEEGTKIFLIANGGTTLDADSQFLFDENGILQTWDGAQWVSVTNLNGVEGVYLMDSQFDTPALNWWGYGDLPEDLTHFTDQWAVTFGSGPDRFISDSPEYGGEVRIEDLNFGDHDFDDTVLRIEKGPVVSESWLDSSSANPDGGTRRDPYTTTTVSGNFFVASVAGIQFVSGADEPLTLNISSLGISNPDAQDSFVDEDDPNDKNVEITILKGGDSGVSKTITSDTGILTIWENGDWEYELVDNTFVHPDNDKGSVNSHDGDYDRYAADQAQDVFAITATDFDGDSVDTNFIVNINDDGPEIGSPQDSVMANAPLYELAEQVTFVAETVQIGPTPINHLTANLSVDYGADGPGGITLGLTEDAPVMALIDGELKQITVGHGQGHLSWQQDSDDSWSAVTESGVKVFTVSVDESNGTYSVDLFMEFDGASSSTTINFGDNLNGGNPDEAVFGQGTAAPDGTNTIYTNGIFLYATSSKDLADDFGWNGTPYNGDDSFGDNPDNNTTVNFSNQGIGVGGGAKIDGNIETERQSEILSLKFLSEVKVENGPKGGVLETTSMAISSATILLDHIGFEDTAYFTLWLSGEQVSNELSYSPTTSEVNTAGGNSSIDLAVSFSSADVIPDASNTNLEFDEIRFEAGSNYRVVSVEISVDNEGFDQTVIIPFEVTDGDGDIAQDDFSITFDGTGAIDATEADQTDGDISTEGMVISGSSGSDTIIGTDFNDTINGGSENDVISGDEGNDIILGTSGNDIIDGGDGDDDIFGGSGEDYILGGSGEDYILGGTEDDYIEGGSEGDELYGNAGDDILKGDEGNDNIFGGPGDDNLEGGTGEDDLYGGLDNDNLYGNEGDDNLYGQAGNDQLIGDDGSDMLSGGPGTDTMVGDEVNYIGDADGNPTPVNNGDSDIIDDGDPDTSFGGTGANDIAGDAGDNDFEAVSVEYEYEDIDTLVPPPEIIV